jgi:hypothetical protein
MTFSALFDKGIKRSIEGGNPVPWGFRLGELITFGEVVCRPQRLKVSIMEARPLLRGVCQIETGTGNFVIHMPQAVVLEGHSGLKIENEPKTEMFGGTIE